MTDPRIEQKSREVAAKVLHLGRSCDPELYAEEIAEIAAALQSAVAEEREECAKAVCEWCRRGCPVIEDKISNANGWYYHKPDPRGLAFTCVAHPIRARGQKETA